MFWTLSLASQGGSGAMAGKWAPGPAHTIGVLLVREGHLCKLRMGDEGPWTIIF